MDAQKNCSNVDCWRTVVNRARAYYRLIKSIVLGSNDTICAVVGSDRIDWTIGKEQQKQEINFGTQSSLDQVMAEVDAVTVDEVYGLAQELLRRGDLSLAALGRIGESGLTDDPVHL